MCVGEHVSLWDTRIPSDIHMCGDTRIPRDACVGHTLPGETRITMTLAMQSSD